MSKPQQQLNSPPRFTRTESFWRLVRYRLHIPMKRSSHPPDHIARGVMVGMAWAMTPFIGLQMTLVFLTWLFTRRVFNWDFSLANGLAWTWTTNVFTVLPIFYIFYVTGQIMLGHFDDITGYQAFKVLFTDVSKPTNGWFESVSQWFADFVFGVGWPMTVGSLPWAVLSGWISYYLALRFVTEFRARRAHAMANAANGKRTKKSPPTQSQPSR